MLSSSRFSASDIPSISPLIYEAFRDVAEGKSFVPDFLDVRSVKEMLEMYVELGNDSYGVLLRNEKDEVVGGNFLCHEGDDVWCVGPVFATKSAPKGVGRKVMEEVMDFAKHKNARSVRLTQAGYNTVSLSLYIKVGFTVREHLCAVDVASFALGHIPISASSRPRLAVASDVEAMIKLCFAAHGHARSVDIRATVAEGHAVVTEVFFFFFFLTCRLHMAFSGRV
jgi:hypothetical protein